MTTTETVDPELADTTAEAEARALRRATRNRWTRIVAVVAGVAAAFAPVTLTGSRPIDMVERALIAALVTFVGAHGHRWSWFAAGVLLAAPDRGPSLFLALAGLAVAVSTTRTRRRPKELGAVTSGLLVNAAFWFQGDAIPWLGLVCACVALILHVASGYRSMRRRHRQVIRVPLLAALGLGVVAVLGTMWAGLVSQRELVDGTSAARDALTAVQDGKGDEARTSLDAARGHLDKASKRMGPAILPARLIPGLAQQVKAVDVAVHEGRHITAAADDLLASADYDQLRYNGRLDLAQVDVLHPGAVHVRDVMATAQRRLDDASESWLLPPLRTRLGEFRDEVADVGADTDLAAELLDLAPALFGGDQPRHYLVIFMTPAELRGAGGFVGSYAELEAKAGAVELTRSGPIKDLITARPLGERKLTGPVDYVRRYGRLHPEDFLQDVTVTPNFPYVGEAMSQLYPQSGGSKVDGVIGVDPTGLAALLKLTGPVTVEGLDEPLTSENAVHILTKRQYVEFSDDDTARKDLLEAATRETFKKLTKASLPAPRTLGDVLGPVARGRHIQVWSPLQAEQALFHRVGADGLIRIPEGNDGFTIAQQNLGNNKIDAYLHRTVTYDAKVDAATGELTAHLKIVLSNDLPDIKFPPDVVANQRNAPEGTNVATLTLLTPHRLVEVSIDGQPTEWGEHTEVGLQAYDSGDLFIPPRGQLTIEIELSGGVDLRHGYHLTVLPQPVANPDDFTATVSAANGDLEGPSTADGKLTLRTLLGEPLRVAAEVVR
jgi:hypothetical protein